MKCAVELESLRAEPRDDAEQVTQALRGEPLRVEERRDGWARVLTAYDYPGWLREAALEEGEGELPPPAEGDPVEMTLEAGRIVLIPIKRRARAGWAEASRSLAEARDDSLVWPEFGNAENETLSW